MYPTERGHLLQLPSISTIKCIALKPNYLKSCDLFTTQLILLKLWVYWIFFPRTKTTMLLKPQCVVLAPLITIFDVSRASAFVQDCARAKKNGGKNFIVASTPDESLLFSSLFLKVPKEHQQRSPRMSEEAFRLDYIQGLKPSYDKITVNDPVEDDHENTLNGMYDGALFRVFKSSEIDHKTLFTSSLDWMSRNIDVYLCSVVWLTVICTIFIFIFIFIME